jgi:glutamate-5-semialdehyde dehydrogenase
VIVPRGGRALIERLEAESRVPLFRHLEGICHVYIDGAADAAMAIGIAVNAKMRRTSICGAAECLVIDRAVLKSIGAQAVKALLDKGCELRGDAGAASLDTRVKAATEQDWGHEFLAPVMAVKIVDGVSGAIEFINRHGSHHTDSIVTGDAKIAERFMNEIESGIVLWNASTQYADGGEFGLGGEIGISTGKLHARGPVGAEQLTTYKYRVTGTGQVRP